MGPDHRGHTTLNLRRHKTTPTHGRKLVQIHMNFPPHHKLHHKNKRHMDTTTRTEKRPMHHGRSKNMQGNDENKQSETLPPSNNNLRHHEPRRNTYQRNSHGRTTNRNNMQQSRIKAQMATATKSRTKIVESMETSNNVHIKHRREKLATPSATRTMDRRQQAITPKMGMLHR